MEAIDPFIKSSSGTAANEENKEDEGVFIEELMIHEDLADPD